MLQQLTRKLMQGEDLSEGESQSALEAILVEDCTDVAIASFLTALSLKGETAPEIAGFARVMRRYAVAVRCNSPELVDTAGTGGGTASFNISTTAAFVIAGAGVSVAKHGNRAVTSSSGSADVLQAMGVKIDIPPQRAERCLNEIGIGFFYAPLFHPAMKRVAGIRQELGHRTIFNMLGPLTNPASAPYQIIGVYAEELTEILGRALALLGCRRAWIVHGRDGLDELSGRAASLVAEVDADQVRNFEFQPEEYGYLPRSDTRYASGDAAENARICRGILQAESRGPHRDVVVLNAAAAIHLATQKPFQQALTAAEESLDSGAALEKLRMLIETTGRPDPC